MKMEHGKVRTFSKTVAISALIFSLWMFFRLLFFFFTTTVKGLNHSASVSYLISLVLEHVNTPVQHARLIVEIKR